MKVIHVEDAAIKRELERLMAQQAKHDGLIDYIACMADVDMPEGDDETPGEVTIDDAQ